MARRVALISDHASPIGVLGGVDAGGQNVYVGQVARHLARAGWDVEVYTRRDRPELPEVMEWQDGVRVVHVDAGPASTVRKEDLLPYMGEFAAWMARRFERTGQTPDVLHANFFMSGLVALELKQRFAIPVVVTFHALGRVRRLHQGAADGFPGEREEIEERLACEADRVIAECPQDEADLVDLYGADRSRITMIPCGFDPEELAPVRKPLARLLLGMPEDQHTVLHVGRMVPRKGVDNLVRGFARFARQHAHSTRLVIVGGESSLPDPALTPEIGRLQEIAREEGVADCVQFEGRAGREQLRYYYSAADVFVTTPWYEPFGITPLEAMACGTPVIGAEVGGIQYSVRDGETGFLVPPHEPDALADRLTRFFADSELRARFGAQAIRRVRAQFTWERVSKQIESTYEEVLMTPPQLALSASTDSRTRAVEEAFDDAILALQRSRAVVQPSLIAAAGMIASAFRRGNKLLICGNGGSAADAQHFAAEFVGRFKRQGRGALPALALTSDGAFLTAWANDAAYEDVFARQVRAFGQPGDVLVGISTSGQSPNLLQAFDAARECGVQTVGILGRDGGPLRARSEVAVVVPTQDTQRIQEVQILLIHLLCELVEEALPNIEPVVQTRGISLSKIGSGDGR